MLANQIVVFCRPAQAEMASANDSPKGALNVLTKVLKVRAEE
jgi:hypothetical protein